MCSARDSAALPALGCPIRESPDQWLLNAYPGLIAVVHALHRLLVPRHPPCALNILTVIKSGRRKRPRQNGRTRSVRRAKPAMAGLTGAYWRPLSVVFPWLWICGFQGPRRGEERGLRSRTVSQNSAARACSSKPQAKSGRHAKDRGGSPARPASRPQSLERR
jgi:hypothetical protein